LIFTEYKQRGLRFGRKNGIIHTPEHEAGELGNYTTEGSLQVMI